MRGPRSPEGAPEIVTVKARRFECQRCGACMLVVPREILRSRLYSACAIAMALALWALMGATEAATRARVSPFAIVGAAAHRRWVTLRRWSADAAVGRLFGTTRAPPEGVTRRGHAERAVAALVALAPSGLPAVDAAFVGGALGFR